MTRPRFTGDAGLSLVEVLVAVSILGLAVTGILSSLGGASIASAAHRRTVSADTVLRDYAEAIKHHVEKGGYDDCPATTTSYSPTSIGFTYPSAIYSVTHSEPLYQGATGFSSACPAPDGGAQSVTLTVSSLVGTDSETLSMIVRKP